MLIEAVGRLCARARHIAYIDWHSLIPIGDGNLIFISFNPDRDARHERAASWWGEAALDPETVDAQWASGTRSEEHTSELQSLMRISYAVFCLKKKNKQKTSKPYDNINNT